MKVLANQTTPIEELFTDLSPEEEEKIVGGFRVGFSKGVSVDHAKRDKT